MSNEKRDEFLSWRGILDQPDALPEQGLDRRDLSWERLDARLRGESGHRGIGWRGTIGWIAAACLVLALIPAFYFFQKRSVTTPTLTLAPATDTSPTVMPAAAPPSQELVDNTPTLRSGPSKESLRKRSAQPHSAADNSNQKPPPDKTIFPAPIAPIINTPPRDSPVLLAQQQEQPPEKVTQSSETTAQPSPKSLINKPLRIVHINELDGRSHPEPAMTSIRERDAQLRVLIILKNH